MPRPRPGIFSTESLTKREKGVWVHSISDLPAGVLAIGADLAAEMRVAAGVGWQLTCDSAVQRVELLCLEATRDWHSSTSSEHPQDGGPVPDGVDLPWQDAPAVTAIAVNLPSQLFWFPEGFHSRSHGINAGADEFLIRSVSPSPANTILCVSTETRVTLSPPVRQGIDVVLLADCSGSMAVDDLELDVSTEANLDEDDQRKPWMPMMPPVKRAKTRMLAVRDVLLRCLEARLDSPSHDSHLALIGFSTGVNIVYPAASIGMMPAGVNTPVADRIKFRDAILSLKCIENSATSLSGPLQYAAELLHRGGRPSNRKVIVLVSDGAEPMPGFSETTTTGNVDQHVRVDRVWKYKKNDSRGSATTRHANDDPYMCMTRLYHESHRRLELIAHPISTRENYRRWCASHQLEPEVAATPNHELLYYLEQACRHRDAEIPLGSPKASPEEIEKYWTTINLEQAIADFGNDLLVSIALHKVATVSPGREDLAELRRLVRLLQRSGDSPERRALRAECIASIEAAVRSCNEIALKAWGYDVFQRGSAIDFLFQRANLPVHDRVSHNTFIIELWAAFKENFAAMLRGDEVAGNKVADLREIRSLFEEFTQFSKGGILVEFRNKAAHDPVHESPPKTSVRELLGARELKNPEDWQDLQLAILRRVLHFVQELQPAVERAAGKCPRRRLVWYVE
jgi:hypothetical protein